MTFTDLKTPAFTRAMAREAGLGPRALKRMLAQGDIISLTRGLYVWGGITLDMYERAQAYGLVLGPHQVICDRSAGWVHSVDEDDFPGESRHMELEVTAYGGHDRTTRAGCAGSTRDLAAGDITQIGTVPVTTELRTCLDLACKLRPMSALASTETFLRDGKVCKDDLIAQLPRYRGRRGIRLAREVIAIADGTVESPGESFTKMGIYQAGLPLPTPQVWVQTGGDTGFRLDHAYEGLKVAVEYDGEEFHGPEQQKYDRARRAWLRDHGWYLIVVRKDRLSQPEVEQWTRELRHVLAERSRKAQRYSRFQWNPPLSHCPDLTPRSA